VHILKPYDISDALGPVVDSLHKEGSVMIIHHIETCDIPVNPLDLMEEIVSSNEWPFDRPSDRELRVEFSGQWCDYRLYFGWAKEISAMQFSCAYDMKVPEPKTSEVCTLLSIINERLWVGHFDLASESRLLSFRHGVLLRGMHGASVEQLEDLVDIALSESERYYPAFQLVVWGGRTPLQAIDTALLETVGEA
jgi:hypothetical protein